MAESEYTANVLLVDPDPSVRRLLKRWITKQLDAEVIEADDGVEALVSLAANEHIDLVVTDLDMPTIDGFEMIQVIRADPRLRRTAVVVMSAIAVESCVREALSLKIHDYILKPLRFAAPQRGQFGNLGRTVGIGPSAAIVDLSILKDFQMPWEGHRLQFRTEMLNMPNHPNFNLPEQRRGRGNFGDVSSLIPGNGARIIQFGLHYKF